MMEIEDLRRVVADVERLRKTADRADRLQSECQAALRDVADAGKALRSIRTWVRIHGGDGQDSRELLALIDGAVEWVERKR